MPHVHIENFNSGMESVTKVVLGSFRRSAMEYSTSTEYNISRRGGIVQTPSPFCPILLVQLLYRHLVLEVMQQNPKVRQMEMPCGGASEPLPPWHHFNSWGCSLTTCIIHCSTTKVTQDWLFFLSCFVSLFFVLFVCFVVLLYFLFLLFAFCFKLWHKPQTSPQRKLWQLYCL